MHAIIKRWSTGLVALAAIAALTACTIGREPAYDAAISGEVTGLTAGTLRLFQELKPGASGTYADREPQYRAVASRVRIPEHPATYSDSIRPPKPGYPATHGAPR